MASSVLIVSPIVVGGRGSPAESKQSNSVDCHMKPNHSQSGSELIAHTWQQGSPTVSIRAVESEENQNQKKEPT